MLTGRKGYIKVGFNERKSEQFLDQKNVVDFRDFGAYWQRFGLQNGKQAWE